MPVRKKEPYRQFLSRLGGSEAKQAGLRASKVVLWISSVMGQSRGSEGQQSQRDIRAWQGFEGKQGGQRASKGG